MATDKLQKALEQENERIAERERQLESTRPDESRPGTDRSLDSPNRHDIADGRKNFDQKIYYFPESFNALRRELEENWLEFFTTVNPLDGTSPAWCMVHNAPQFIGYCNGATGLSVQFDSENVSGICGEFLNAFRKMRGVSAIH